MRAHPPINIDPNVRSPRYAQVYAILRDWILQGVYEMGERMPSESELSEIFAVSRITVRSAVEMLEKEGMVERIQGRGTFVSSTASDTPNRGDLSELVRRLRTLDGRSRLTDLVIATEAADDQVVRDLQIQPGDQVVHASYIRERDGEAIGVTDIYIPSSLKVDILPNDLHGPSPILLETKGIAILGAHQFIGAALADSQLSSKLDVPVGSPLVRLSLLVLAEDSTPVELLMAYYRADKYTHHVFLASRSTPAMPR